ncbi:MULTISPECIES: porin family protein [Leeuwenhoekiella]|jgi:hypothetical protein|uniref:Outer membrane protein beta-barrel domain-containing protein n=1 Tax=Leeuwenhoekiella blandensis (strain CECT 7118 / CCUG 51940 / KCTC 22103 / MED217) TaxID=398720 RepID=A3XN61_LEEBM|nr:MULTISPECIES: porin family protein [Leeuwenhoekiella]MAG87213.1 PorT family protein [Flavobacteriaceae bacterium]EAQ49018.1 hypothetical protein MED217_10727 [Leeuwenhoekiella blandensis MED217]MAO44894.1 PorT family protein [Leeuwenhoekiella sp.]HBT11080.1 PorT family protein [Leeuwenhoekiella sp.]HCW63486.1 PorT family protein [Leeuwenhoekiella sp.]|tara:strand:- start:3110 stop:3697 length:588 start_codon:yes stop_codon:yes gene_type:complete
MKKFLLGIFLLASISTFAQGVRYGAKMGMNFSTLDGDAFENSSTRYGFAAGIFAEIPLGSAFQFQPELLYSGQGIKPNTGPEGNFGFDVNGVPERPFDERAELDYIQLPLLIKKNFGKFNIHLGPQVGIAVWNSYNNGIYKNFDYSGIGGIGVQIFDFLALEARYSVGFRNVIEPNNQNIEGTNQYFALMASYRL